MLNYFILGAVKISPAHDKNDYEVGVRHNLAFITVISDDGKIVGDYGEFTVRFEVAATFKNISSLRAAPLIVKKLLLSFFYSSI